MSIANDEKLLKQNIRTRARVGYCNNEAKKLLEDDPQQSLLYAKEALETSQSLSLSEEEIRAISNMAWSYYYLDNYNKATYHSLNLLALLNVQDDTEERSSALSLLGHVYRKTGNFDLSLEHYFEALKLYEHLDNQYEIAYTYRFIAIVYTHVKNYKCALEYAFKALNIFKNVRIEPRIATAMLTISDIYREMNGSMSRKRTS